MIKSLELPNFFARFSPAQTKRQTYTNPVSPARFWLAVVLIGLNVVLLVSYLLSVNKQGLQGYEIKTVQTRLAKLADDNRLANLKVSEATSIVGIQTDFLNSNFVQAGTSKFLQANTNQYTQR